MVHPELAARVPFGSRLHGPTPGIVCNPLRIQMQGRHSNRREPLDSATSAILFLPLSIGPSGSMLALAQFPTSVRSKDARRRLHVQPTKLSVSETPALQPQGTSTERFRLRHVFEAMIFNEQSARNCGGVSPNLTVRICPACKLFGDESPLHIWVFSVSFVDMVCFLVRSQHGFVEPLSKHRASCGDSMLFSCAACVSSGGSRSPLVLRSLWHCRFVVGQLNSMSSASVRIFCVSCLRTLFVFHWIASLPYPLHVAPRPSMDWKLNLSWGLSIDTRVVFCERGFGRVLLHLLGLNLLWTRNPGAFCQLSPILLPVDSCASKEHTDPAFLVTRTGRPSPSSHTQRGVGSSAKQLEHEKRR